MTHLCLMLTSTSNAILSDCAPLLPSVTQEQHVTESRWEVSTSTAIPPTSASDVLGQHNKIGGIIFSTAPIVPRALCQ